MINPRSNTAGVAERLKGLGAVPWIDPDHPMCSTLTLPNGETVSPGAVVLYEGYPYRYVEADSADTAFVLSPLYWGGSPLDVPFPSREALVAQWSEESRGTLTEAEWEAWLDDARADDRFGDEELDAVAAEVLGDERAPPGPLDRLRRLLGR